MLTLKTCPTPAPVREEPSALILRTCPAVAEDPEARSVSTHPTCRKDGQGRGGRNVSSPASYPTAGVAPRSSPEMEREELA